LKNPDPLIEFKKMNEHFIRHLMSAVSCSVCGALYEGDNVQVLGRHSDLWFLSVYCSICENEGLVAAILEKGQTAKLISDLSADDFTKLHEVETIDSADVLSLHDFLEDFDGDFAKLFSTDDGSDSAEFC
jgi:hypothetical protein